MSSLKLKIKLRSLAYHGYKQAKNGNPFWTEADAWNFLAATVEVKNN